MNWQPISTAPKDGTRFLTWHGGRARFFRWQEVPGNPVVGWRDDFIYVYREGDPTGPQDWMPEPPEPVPGQIREAPELGTVCWMHSPELQAFVWFVYGHTDEQRTDLRAGRLFLTEAAVIAHRGIDGLAKRHT